MLGKIDIIFELFSSFFSLFSLIWCLFIKTTLILSSTVKPPSSVGRYMVANFVKSYKVMYSEEGRSWRYYTIDRASAPRVCVSSFYDYFVINPKVKLSGVELKLFVKYLKVGFIH